MTRAQLINQIHQKETYLCVGLDSDLSKIPSHLLTQPDPVFEFNKQIIDATRDLCVAYKINTAFYEAMGWKGWETMEKTVRYIGDEHFKIADAKRGDIGNTSSQYAKAFFETLPFDSITVAPYMGEDSVRPFLAYDGKWAIVLGLTSNSGAKDFEWKQLKPNNDIAVDDPGNKNVIQEKMVGGDDKVVGEDDKMVNRDDKMVGGDDKMVGGDDKMVGGDDKMVGGDTNHGASNFLYEQVLSTVSEWGTPDNLMFVVGATRASAFTSIRLLTPHHFYLVPGVGAQGGSLREISEKAMIKKDIGLLVNVSRAIIYASEKEDFRKEARAIALQYKIEMASYLR